MIGGAPRTGKSILGQQLAAKLGIGWISTDFLLDLLRFKGEDGVKTEWNAAPEAIARDAAWFYPYLERFVRGISSQAGSYLVEGVDFLPTQVAQLSALFPVRAVFLGCSQMTLERFDRFPRRSHGYASLPEAIRRQFAEDIPAWSEHVRREAERCGYPYIDTSDNFESRLNEAESFLKAGADPL